MPTLREINPDHIVLHAGKNNLRTENTASQIAKATTHIAIFLKIMLTRLGKLNNKVNEVNRFLVLMCKERNTSFISHDESIDPSKARIS